MLAEIITIGDELLIGQVIDTNSAFIAKELNKIGVSVYQITSVQDDKNHILTAFKDAERLKKAVAEKDYHEAYQAAHKMKPTVDLFELGVLDTLIEVQDWGKFQKIELDITNQLAVVLNAVDLAVNEIRSDFNL